MSKREQQNQSASEDNIGERRHAALPPTGEQPLILFDLATLIGTAYQQSVTVTRQQRVARRVADMLRQRLYGLPRFDEQHVDTYVEMLFNMATRLGLLVIVDPLYEGEGRSHYRPARTTGLEQWSQWHAHEQARAFLEEWRTNSAWRDIWSADLVQWDASDWNPLAARGLLLDLLSANFYRPEQWYLVSPLLDEIWSRNPYFLRPTRQKERTRTQAFPYALQGAWNRCERLVYLGILSSTLSELGIVSLASSTADFTTGPVSQPTRFRLTEFGARVLSKSNAHPAPRNTRRLLVVQPSFAVILLQFDVPILYQLLPFTEIEHIEQACRLTLTRNSILRGLENDMSIEQMLTVLRTFSQVPQNVVRTMQDWASAYRGAATTEVILIETANEATANELCSSPRWRAYGLEKIASCRVLAHRVIDHWEFRSMLRRAGITLRE